MKTTLIFALLLSLFQSFAQKPEYATGLIPENLKENANAVVRLNQLDITIASRSSMTLHTLRVVTVLNELGMENVNAYEYYDVKSIEATIYDAAGKELRKIKRKDFHQVAVSEGAIITDNKRTYLDYTPTQYPFTIVYESETTSSNTAFIPSWFPNNEPLVGVQKSTINILYPSDLGFKYKAYNFENAGIKKEEKPNSLSFTSEHIPAIKSEQYSPSLNKFVPYVLFGLEKFKLEGVEGDATSWENFGLWTYNNLLAGTDELPVETQSKIKALVGDEKDPIKKAKIVYAYVQGKTRYVSISLGIGGWKPMKAKDVDRLGYGDCKALSNYTRSLLNVVGVPSYYTIIYGDEDKRDLRPDFVSMQGNHVILAIPNENKITWLECTSQIDPFGFQANFTDDRMALLVKPTGGELVRTSIYESAGNSQFTKGNYTLDASGKFSGTLEIKSKGTQYANRLKLENKSSLDLNTFYKDYFSINNLTLKKISVSNDRNNVEFTETISLDADRYANPDNQRLIFAVNAFNQYSRVPQRYRSRSNPFEISRGFVDYDEITIDLPAGFSIEAKPENMQIKDKFGAYQAEYVLVNPKQMLYKRTLTIAAGYYDSKEYENYRKFREQVAKADNSKMVLIKS